MPAGEPADYDSPWKEAVEQYFPAFLAFYFPVAFAGIDWSRGYEFLDTELQQVVRDAELGTRLADKLVKVWRKDGVETWVLIHLEVQGQVDPHFPERMFVYHYRIYDRFRLPVASFALLGDDRHGWRPAEFGYNLWECDVRLRFPMVKLLDFGPKLVQLESETNVFAVLTAAHLEAQATRGQLLTRYQSRLRLAKTLYQRGYSRGDVLALLRFLDWILALPDELERTLDAELKEYEGEITMPYVSSFERRAIEEGLRQGRELGQQEGKLAELRESVIEIASERFPALPEALCEQIRALRDEGRLRALRGAALRSPDFRAFEASLNEAAGN